MENPIPTPPRVGQSYGQAWRNMWPHFWVLLAMVTIGWLVGLPGQLGNALPPDMWLAASILGGVGLLLAILVGGPLSLGILAANLKVTRGHAPAWSDLGLGFRRYGQAVLVTLLVFLIIMAGFILLVIPGIYLSVRMFYAPYRFVHDGVDAAEAIKASWNDARGRWWHTFGMGLMAIPVLLAGLLALGVGVFVAAVWIQQANAVWFRSVRQVAAA